MKKIKWVAAGLAIASLLCVSLTSCEDLLSLFEDGDSGKTEKEMFTFDKISVNSFDSEKVNLKGTYSLNNKYNVSVSVAEIMADIKCDGNDFTSVKASDGIALEANASKQNSFDFDVPYDAIINFAKSYANAKKSLPFSVSGNVGFDLSAVSFLPLENQTLRIPYNFNFAAPVFKPSFSATKPSLNKEALVNSLKAAGGQVLVAVLASLASGDGLSANVFSQVDIPVTVNFNLGVKNEGGSAWNYLLKKCSISTGNEGEDTITLDTTSCESITATEASIPLAATISTRKFSKFIADLYNGTSSSNPKFTIESGVSFPELAGGLFNDIPLNYQVDIPIN